MIDSHVHLDFIDFEQDISDVLSRAQLAGVNQFIVPGVSLDTWPRLAQFARKQSNVHAAFGLHPYFLKPETKFPRDELIEILTREDAVAVGECGVDSSRPNLQLQIDMFEQHIEVANELSKPLIVHHRKSHHHIFSSFKRKIPKFGGVIHAFSGSLQDAEKYIEKGFFLGCGGTITYDRANKTREVFKQVPLDNIVLETDSPDMPLSGLQGQRNEPANLKTIATALSALRNEPLALITQQTVENTERLFGLEATLLE